jgi:hypothetical protein
VKGRRRVSECLWSFEDTLKQCLPPDRRTGRRKTRWPVFTVSSRRLRSVQPARIWSDRGLLSDIQWRWPAAAPVSVAQEHGDFVDELTQLRRDPPRQDVSYSPHDGAAATVALHS